MKKLSWLPLAANAVLSRAGSLLCARTGLWRHAPFSVEFALTARCNLRCAHCEQWLQAEDSSLKQEDWLRLVRELRAWLGPYQLTVGWGEPLLYPGLAGIISGAAALGVSTCVITNGTLLDEKAADLLCASGLDRLMISLDGLSAQRHDATRGVPGTYDKVVRAIGHILSRRPRPITVLSTTLNAANLAEAAGIVAFAEKTGLDGVSLQPMFPVGAGWRELWPSDHSAVDRCVDELLAMKRAGARITNSEWVLAEYKRYFRGLPFTKKGTLCKSYMKFIVRHNGDVQFCRHAAPVGSVLRTPPRELYSAPETTAALKKIAGCSEACIMMGCHHVDSFSDRLKGLLQIIGRRQ